MHFKLIIALVEDDKTDAVMDAARKQGATGATFITNARGEGLKPNRTFFGLSLETQRDVLLLLGEEHRSRTILETICEVAKFESEPGTGIAVQIDVEDAVGITHQMQTLAEENRALKQRLTDALSPQSTASEESMAEVDSTGSDAVSGAPGRPGGARGLSSARAG